MGPGTVLRASVLPHLPKLLVSAAMLGGIAGFVALAPSSAGTGSERVQQSAAAATSGPVAVQVPLTCFVYDVNVPTNVSYAASMTLTSEVTPGTVGLGGNVTVTSSVAFNFPAALQAVYQKNGRLWLPVTSMTLQITATGDAAKPLYSAGGY